MLSTIQDYLNNVWPAKSYAMGGEDLVINSYFKGQNAGFFVDIGAHDPFRFSNTYMFYKRGWTGINIDPLPGTESSFKKHRPKDITLEIGIAQNEGELTYYMYNEPALNGFSKQYFEERGGKKGYSLINSVNVPVRRLDQVLDQYMDKSNVIDFLTIDTEGLDIEVVKSNNWDKYRPKIVMMEHPLTDMEGLEGTEVYGFMASVGYKLVGKVFDNILFQSRS